MPRTLRPDAAVDAPLNSPTTLPPVIIVIAGVNGAGKSSIVGERIRSAGSNYFNPDEAARRIRTERACSVEEANSLAWHEGKNRLEAAIENRGNFTFESTLAGNTIPALLVEAAKAGFEIDIWFVGLASPEQHIARVQARVAAGGHDIPVEKIRERWDSSRRNIVALLPWLNELRVFDNSAEGVPERGTIPAPRELLHYQRGRLVKPSHEDLEATPEWGKPIVVRAIQLVREQSV